MNGPEDQRGDAGTPGWRYEPAHDLGLPIGERLRSVRRESGLVETCLRAVWWSVVRGYLGAYHRLRIVGLERLPASPPFILIANHASHLDALVLMSAVKWRDWDRAFPIAAADVFFERDTVAAFAAGVLNALPMRRNAWRPRTLGEMRDRLAAEERIYILFPEGKRSRDGAMLPFRPGVGLLAAGSRVPVVPCFLDGVFGALRPGCVAPRPRRITLTIGEPLRFEATPNDPEGWRAVARTLEERVRALAGASAPGYS